MTKGLVSVIIPAFNAAEYIRETLHSALAQTYQALEVIVVDDGSTDATGSIVEEFAKKDARVQLVKQCNAGVGAARNTGIRMARGEYIAPLDADDIWFPEKLEKQVARMEHYGEETGMVYCWSILVDKDGGFKGFGFPSTAQGRLPDTSLLEFNTENASVPLFRTTALARVGLYLTRAEQGGAQGCEDWDLNIRIAEAFSIGLVPEFLVGYVRAGSSMSVDGKGMAASFSVVMQRARQRNPDLPDATFRGTARDFYLFLVDWAHYSSRFYCMKKAICVDPALLLKTATLKRLIKIQLRAITNSIRKNFVQRGRPSSGKKGNENNLHSEDRNRPSIINAIFSASKARSAALGGESVQYGGALQFHEPDPFYRTEVGLAA